MDNDEYFILDNLHTIDVSTISSSEIVIDTDANSSYIYANNTWTWADENKLWETHLPHPTDLENMCKEYPALERAYENFKTVYKMVEQDWIGKQSENDDII